MVLVQLEKAEKYVAYHMEKFGFASPNVSFKLGYLEDLGGADLEENFFDVIV